MSVCGCVRTLAQRGRVCARVHVLLFWELMKIHNNPSNGAETVVIT